MKTTMMRRTMAARIVFPTTLCVGFIMARGELAPWALGIHGRTRPFDAFHGRERAFRVARRP
jgi:hypothetical protein